MIDFEKLVLEKLNYQLSQTQLNQFNDYYEFLVQYNENVNLTRITEKEEVYIKHFYDSIQITCEVQFSNQKVCDMGSGAGFPGIPIKILFPDLELTIVDASLKRLTFLNLLIKKLNLKNVVTIHTRVEQYQNENPNYFDIVTARALSTLDNLVKWSFPILKTNGCLIAYKAKNFLEELELIEKKHHSKIASINVINQDLPDKQGERNNIIIKKA